MLIVCKYIQGTAHLCLLEIDPKARYALANRNRTIYIRKNTMAVWTFFCRSVYLKACIQFNPSIAQVLTDSKNSSSSFLEKKLLTNTFIIRIEMDIVYAPIILAANDTLMQQAIIVKIENFLFLDEKIGTVALPRNADMKCPIQRDTTLFTRYLAKQHLHDDTSEKV